MEKAPTTVPFVQSLSLLLLGAVRVGWELEFQEVPGSLLRDYGVVFKYSTLSCHGILISLAPLVPTTDKHDISTQRITLPSSRSLDMLKNNAEAYHVM